MILNGQVAENLCKWRVEKNEQIYTYPGILGSYFSHGESLYFVGRRTFYPVFVLEDLPEYQIEGR